MSDQKPGKTLFLSEKKETVPQTVDWRGRYEQLRRQTKKVPLLDFYQTPLPDPITPIKDVKLLALDLETTGMDPEHHAIVSIGFVPFTIQGIDLGGACHMLVKPEMPLSEESAVIHAITHTQLSNAEGFHVHFKTLLAAMKHHIPVVHYHHIERTFLAHSVNRFFSDPFEFPLIDTMRIEDRLMRRPKKTGLLQRGLDWIWRNRKEPHRHSLRLDAVRTRYNLPRYSPHHALTDALSTAELFMAQVQTRFDPQTPLSEFWI